MEKSRSKKRSLTSIKRPDSILMQRDGILRMKIAIQQSWKNLKSESGVSDVIAVPRNIHDGAQGYLYSPENLHKSGKCRLSPHPVEFRAGEACPAPGTSSQSASPRVTQCGKIYVTQLHFKWRDYHYTFTTVRRTNPPNATPVLNTHCSSRITNADTLIRCNVNQEPVNVIKNIER